MSASFLRPPSSDSHMLYAFVIAQLLRESRYHGEDPVAACFFFMASATEQEFSDLSRDELCSLYFGRTLHSGLGQPEHFLVPPNRLGPVRVGKRDSTKEGRGLFVTRTVQPGELLLVSNPLVAAPVGEWLFMCSQGEMCSWGLHRVVLVRDRGGVRDLQGRTRGLGGGVVGATHRRGGGGPACGADEPVE